MPDLDAALPVPGWAIGWMVVLLGLPFVVSFVAGRRRMWASASAATISLACSTCALGLGAWYLLTDLGADPAWSGSVGLLDQLVPAVVVSGLLVGMAASVSSVLLLGWQFLAGRLDRDPETVPPRSPDLAPASLSRGGDTLVNPLPGWQLAMGPLYRDER